MGAMRFTVSREERPIARRASHIGRCYSPLSHTIVWSGRDLGAPALATASNSLASGHCSSTHWPPTATMRVESGADAPWPASERAGRWLALATSGAGPRESAAVARRKLSVVCRRAPEEAEYWLVAIFVRCSLICGLIFVTSCVRPQFRYKTRLGFAGSGGCKLLSPAGFVRTQRASTTRVRAQVNSGQRLGLGRRLYCGRCKYAPPAARCACSQWAPVRIRPLARFYLVSFYSCASGAGRPARPHLAALRSPEAARLKMGPAPVFGDATTTVVVVVVVVGAQGARM